MEPESTGLVKGLDAEQGKESGTFLEGERGTHRMKRQPVQGGGDEEVSANEQQCARA